MNFHTPSTFCCLPILAIGCLVPVAQAATWSAVGTVKNTSNSPLSGVAISVKDSNSTLKASTDGNGTFVIGSATGILPSALPIDFSVRQSGNELKIAFPGEGILDLRLVDLSGTTLWKGSAPLAGGYASAILPTFEGRGAAILRVALGSQLAYQPITVLGSEGFSITTRISARSLATNPTLVFKKVGYADTTYNMTSTNQTGIAVVMRDSSTPVATSCKLPSGPNSGSGSFTYYWFGQGSYQENGHYALACGYHGSEQNPSKTDPRVDDITNISTPHYFVAIPGASSDNFGNVDKCGACVELTGKNGTKLVATVADECPENSNAPCAANPGGHLDVSYGAFSQLGFGSIGNPSGTSWKYVKCPVTGNIVVRIKVGNPNQIYVENTILPIKSISVGGAQATHLSYGAWQISRVAVGASLSITDYSDRTINYTVPGSLAADQDQNTGVQFPACQ